MNWPRWILTSERLRRAGALIAVWLIYVATIEAIGSSIARDEGQRTHPGARRWWFHGFIDDLATVPALARWDSIWYYGIAKEGYGEIGPESRGKAAFLPLYPMLMRFVGTTAQVDFFTAGIWVSRLALLASLLLLPLYLRDHGQRAAEIWPVAAALLAFPSAYILTAVYTESLFLALVLATFVLAHRHREWAATVASLLAALTRPHGWALVPALTVHGWIRWRSGRRSVVVFLPATAPLAAYAALAACSVAQFGDILRHFAVRRELFRQEVTAPWVTIETSAVAAEAAVAQGNLGAFYPCLELPCLCLICVALVLLWDARQWTEMVYVASGAALSLLSGSLAGLPRYTLVLFPVIVVVARAHRYPALWYAFLISACLVQACLLVEFINFRGPAP